MNAPGKEEIVTKSEIGDQVQMSVRVPADLAEALERVASQEDRTVSAELRRIIRQHVTSHDDRLRRRTGGV